MNSMTKNDRLKIKILKQYKKHLIDYTSSYLSNMLNHKFETVKKALDFFYEIGVMEKEIKDHGNKTITYYSLTDLGLRLINSNKI